MSNSKDFTQGNIFKKLISFMIPVLGALSKRTRRLLPQQCRWEMNCTESSTDNRWKTRENVIKYTCNKKDYKALPN